MRVSFICMGTMEIIAVIKQIKNITGVCIVNFDLDRKILVLSGITSKNHDEVCTKLREVGYRKDNI